MGWNAVTNDPGETAGQMKIAVVLLSQEHATQAGVRIRYQRIASQLKALGHSLDMIPISEFSAGRPPKHDLYLFSKCHDARSLILARLLRQQGRHVGIDGFDDYFSQTDDSRHVRQREWLRDIAPYCDFFLTSTLRMQEVFQAYMPNVPGHVLNDPFNTFSPNTVTNSIDARLERARRDRRINVAWFGVGDHPTFPVGLRDLTGQSHVLWDLQRRGYEVRLHVLTNRRALSADGLALLRRLDLPFEVEEWSLTAESRLLEKNLIAFIPVSAQRFSIAKSLNRAVTALTAGTQVLSPSYPLYEPLGEFIYRSADELADNICDGHLKMHGPSMKNLTTTLKRWSDPALEASSLSSFFSTLPSLPNAGLDFWQRGMGGVIHGVTSPNVCTDLARSMRHLSVSAPFSEGRKSDDIRFIRKADGLKLRISKAAIAHLGPAASERIARFGQRLADGGAVARLVDIAPSSRLEDYMDSHPVGATPLLSGYSEGLGLLRETLVELTPAVDFFLSEKAAPHREVRTP